MRKFSSYIVLRGLLVLISLLQIKAITHFFNAAEIGVLFLIVAIMQVVSVVGSSPYGNYAYREWLDKKSDSTKVKFLSGIITSATIFQVLIGASVICVFELMSGSNFLIDSYILWMALIQIIMASTIKIVANLANISNEKNRFFKIEITYAITSLIVPIIFINIYSSSVKVWVLGTIVAATLTVFYMTYFGRIIRLGSYKWQLRHVIRAIKHVNCRENYKLVFLPVAFLAFSGWIEMHMHKLVLSKFLDIETLGILLITQRIISQVLNNGNTVLTMYFSPMIYHAIHEKNLKVLNGHIAKYILFLVLGSIVTSVTAELLIEIISNEEFVADFIYTQIIVFLVCISLIVKLSTYYFQFYKRFDIAVKPTLMSLTLYVFVMVLIFLTYPYPIALITTPILMLLVRGVLFKVYLRKNVKTAVAY